MKDIEIKNTGDSRYLKSALSETATWEQARKMLIDGTFPIDLNGVNLEGINQAGTPINTATMMPQETADRLGLSVPDPVVKDGFDAVAVIKGEGVPTEKTDAKAVGQLYIDTSAKDADFPKIYQCTAIEDGKANWVRLTTGLTDTRVKVPIAEGQNINVGDVVNVKGGMAYESEIIDTTSNRTEVISYPRSSTAYQYYTVGLSKNTYLIFRVSTNVYPVSFQIWLFTVDDYGNFSVSSSWASTSSRYIGDNDRPWRFINLSPSQILFFSVGEEGEGGYIRTDSIVMTVAETNISSSHFSESIEGRIENDIFTSGYTYSLLYGELVSHNKVMVCLTGQANGSQQLISLYLNVNFDGSGNFSGLSEISVKPLFQADSNGKIKKLNDGSYILIRIDSNNHLIFKHFKLSFNDDDFTLQELEEFTIGKIYQFLSNYNFTVLDDDSVFIFAPLAGSSTGAYAYLYTNENGTYDLKYSALVEPESSARINDNILYRYKDLVIIFCAELLVFDTRKRDEAKYKRLQFLPGNTLYGESGTILFDLPQYVEEFAVDDVISIPLIESSYYTHNNDNYTSTEIIGLKFNKNGNSIALERENNDVFVAYNGSYQLDGIPEGYRYVTETLNATAYADGYINISPKPAESDNITTGTYVGSGFYSNVNSTVVKSLIAKNPKGIIIAGRDTSNAQPQSLVIATKGTDTAFGFYSAGADDLNLANITVAFTNDAVVLKARISSSSGSTHTNYGAQAFASSGLTYRYIIF